MAPVGNGPYEIAAHAKDSSFPSIREYQIVGLSYTISCDA
jgi:hypothetical protein